MKIRALVALGCVFAFQMFAIADTWTSPDGLLSIVPPDTGKFRADQSPPPPLVALWVSNDESMKLAVMKMAIPPNTKIIQSSVEEGLAEEVGGEVTRLPTTHTSGHEVWRMSSKGPSAHISQAIVQHNDTLYKLMAVATDGELDGEVTDRFIDSLSIRQPSGDQLGQGMDSHTLSKRIGGGSVLLLCIALLALLVRRGKSSRQT